MNVVENDAVSGLANVSIRTTADCREGSLTRNSFVDGGKIASLGWCETG
jgi:hypothetical protein